MWQDGYVTGIPYTRHFHRSQAATVIAFLAAIKGWRSGLDDAGFAAIDLGCGHGFSTAVQAAAHPAGRYFAVDINPEHVEAGTTLARTAGLANATYLAADFAALADRDLPDFDLVTMHGVWTWVSASARDAALAFIARKLKPGGLVFVSYNTLAGQSVFVPVRRLMLDIAKRVAGSPQDRIATAIGIVQGALKGKHGLAGSSGVVRALSDRIAKAEPSYVAHEYLNDDWTLFTYSEVAQSFREIGLTSLGQSALLYEVRAMNLEEEPAKAAAAINDPDLREDALDLVRGRMFRTDVYVRGTGRRSDAEIAATLPAWRFALAADRGRCDLKMRAPIGEVTLPAASYGAILDALAQGPLALADLLATPWGSALGLRGIARALVVLVGSGMVEPIPPGWGGGDPGIVARFNRAVIDGARRNVQYNALAAPVVASAVHVSPTVLRHLTDDPVPPALAATVAHLRQVGAAY